MVGGNVLEDILQRADLDRTVIRNYLVVLAAELSRDAQMRAALASDRVAELS